MRQKLLAVLMASMLVLAGCSGIETGPGESGDPSDGISGDATGTVNFYISDQQNAIDDFEHLNVTITEVGFHRADEGDDNESDTEEPTDTPESTDETVTEATDTEMDDEEREGWQEFEVNETTVDLTELQGANATLLQRFNVTNGTYDKVFIHVSEVNGTLKDGGQAEVKLPSSKIQLNQRFTVGDGEDVDFVYDITVVKRGNSGKYNIKPVASESGTDVDIERVDEDDESEAEGDGDDDEGESNANASGQSMGQMDFYVSDERNAIDDFRYLNVTITEVGLQRGGESGNWTTYDVNDATVDLTELQGANATMLAQLDVEAGTYTKVFVHVESVNGTLTNGEATDVKLPSSKLQLNKEFEVGANESVDFVYDITVVKRGNSGKYNVKPVVGESGTDVPIEDVDDEDEADDDREDETDEEASADLNATFVGNVSAGENATVRVTANGSAVENATVTYDGTEYTTNADGEVTFAVPDDAEEVEVAVAYVDGEVELSDDLTGDDDEQADGDRAERETATGSTATPTPTPSG